MRSPAAFANSFVTLLFDSMSMHGLAPAVGDTIKPLYVDGEVLYASRGLKVFTSRDGGESYEPFATCPGLPGERWTSRSRLLRRLGRLGVQVLRPLPDGGAVAVLRRRIAWCAPGNRRFREVLRMERGSRPLDICVTSSGRVYFGEYFNNPDRESVHVYGSEDGEHWSVVHTFPAGSIRHVHNIVEDPYRKGLWVLTGDSDDESGLWFTGDNFQTLDCVVGGTQRARAVALIPLEDSLIVPTDTPYDQNYVQHCDPEQGQLTRVAPLPNSAFHAIEQRGLLLISTVAEPSSCNDSQSAAVFVSQDGAQWQRLATFERDWALIRQRHRFVDRAIRHPEVKLVPGRNETDFLFGFGRGVRGADGRLLRWSRARLLNYVESPLAHAEVPQTDLDLMWADSY